jgi:hypothetical protein
VKLFRKSPLKNITLQKYVKEELGHELNLLFDVRKYKMEIDDSNGWTVSKTQKRYQKNIDWFEYAFNVEWWYW